MELAVLNLIALVVVAYHTQRNVRHLSAEVRRSEALETEERERPRYEGT